MGILVICFFDLNPGEAGKKLITEEQLASRLHLLKLLRDLRLNSCSSRIRLFSPSINDPPPKSGESALNSTLSLCLVAHLYPDGKYDFQTFLLRPVKMSAPVCTTHCMTAALVIMTLLLGINVFHMRSSNAEVTE